MNSSALSQVFSYSDKTIRVAGSSDKPLFCAADVCAVDFFVTARNKF